jgi:quinol-cytochrome oxidoreductase complex cytochrome b subunit
MVAVLVCPMEAKFLTMSATLPAIVAPNSAVPFVSAQTHDRTMSPILPYLAWMLNELLVTAAVQTFAPARIIEPPSRMDPAMAYGRVKTLLAQLVMILVSAVSLARPIMAPMLGPDRAKERRFASSWAMPFSGTGAVSAKHAVPAWMTVLLYQMVLAILWLQFRATWILWMVLAVPIVVMLHLCQRESIIISFSNNNSYFSLYDES